jgi:hypothetical protein
MIDYPDVENDYDILRPQYETVHWKPLMNRMYCTFPPPSDININMMPFYVEPTYSTIPEVMCCTNAAQCPARK